MSLTGIPPAARLGLSPFDLQPGSTMTNAVMEGMVEFAGGRELTLNYKSDSVKVLVPPGTPMSQSVPGSRADIRPGETVFVVARVGESDKMTAARIQVSKDGVNQKLGLRPGARPRGGRFLSARTCIYEKNW